MLQAATGKLFTNRENPRRQDLKGVIYSNLDLGAIDRLSTRVGTLVNLESSRTPAALGYEMTEYMEAADPAPGVLVSRAMAAYIDDFADVASFSLQVIFSPDVHIAERLLYQRQRPGNRSPSERLARFYDNSVRATESEMHAFEQFADQLIDLPRANYLAVIQAIRTYVAAVHRMGDDLNLAYTLLVMCVESLAQKFDGHEPKWVDLPDQKRAGVDEALLSVSEENSQKVRDAVLEVIHPRLGFRFVQFILAHLPADYFSVQADAQKHPIGRRDLEAALQNLYGVRSSYVHTLKPLTKEFIHFASHRETWEDDGKLTFTFQGLFRLVRAVIIEFVRKAPKIEREPCNYEWDNPNLIRLRVAPQYWIYDPSGFEAQSSRRYLQGLVELLDECLVEYPNRKLHGLSHIIDKGLSIQPQMNEAQNVPFLALWWLSNVYLGHDPARRTHTSKEVEMLNKPSVDSLITQALLGSDSEWKPAIHQLQLDRYYKQRYKSSGIRVPANVEACMALTLAERHRKAGHISSAHGALTSAAENFPHLIQLRTLAADFDPSTPIAWLSIIYPGITMQRATLECVGL
ncbi:hypothetical protein PS925_00856 [Pseudomonas fluorescens]|uniref:Uncharacterized protein n=1 Tax=Pseudomonas fluorescens TaxID=294 RepID=A0A5E7SF68_PSEFL|nr:hypothetical protein [Pseudomonas fluorescens]VVP85186.1 hypothetical protein PS925_00856 [Pseudomonas fluorescens]